MEEEIYTQLIAIYNLGEIKTIPLRIHGGLLHKIWKIETSKRSYAIKELNNKILSRSGVKESYINSENVAKEFADKGINAIYALQSINQNTIEIINNNYFQVYPWVEGKSQETNIIDINHSEIMGNILANIHSIDLQNDNLPDVKYDFISEKTWQNLDKKCSNSKWASNFHNLIPYLLNLTPAILEAQSHLSQESVISHRDLDQKNVLWDENNIAYLIDWESAGRINPYQEVITAAIDWSCNLNTNKSKDAFQILIKGYLQKRKMILESSIQSLYLVLNNKMNWLKFNILRAIGEFSKDPEEINIGNKEVIKTMNSIQFTISNLDNYKQWVEEIFE